jgi:hypothetical protein
MQTEPALYLWLTNFLSLYCRYSQINRQKLEKVHFYKFSRSRLGLQICTVLSVSELFLQPITLVKFIQIYFSSIVLKAVSLLKPAQIRSWNQPVLSNECKVSCRSR